MHQLFYSLILCIVFFISFAKLSVIYREAYCNKSFHLYIDKGIFYPHSIFSHTVFTWQFCPFIFLWYCDIPIPLKTCLSQVVPTLDLIMFQPSFKPLGQCRRFWLKATQYWRVLKRYDLGPKSYSLRIRYIRNATGEMFRNYLYKFVNKKWRPIQN